MGKVTIQRSPDGPIEEVDESLPGLVKFEYPQNGGALVTEYYIDKILVHRSVTAGLVGVTGTGAAGGLG